MNYNYNDDGSYWSGWWLGFLLGLIGLIIVIAIGKPETKRGALHGFIIFLVIIVVYVVCVSCGVIGSLGSYEYY